MISYCFINDYQTDDGVLERCGGFYERYNGDLNTIPNEYAITTDAISETELRDSMELAVFVDTYLREHHSDYDRIYSQIQETQESISDNLLSGKTHKLKILFEEMGLTEKGQRSSYLGDDGCEKIDTFIHEREVEKMDDKLKVLIVEPMCEPYVKEIDSGLESLQKKVGGLMQVTYPYEDLVGIINILLYDFNIKTL